MYKSKLYLWAGLSITTKKTKLADKINLSIGIV